MNFRVCLGVILKWSTLSSSCSSPTFPFPLLLYRIQSDPPIQFHEMGSGEKVFSLKEVAEHNNHKDCWLIISGKVYDVTKFLEDHPGGDDVMLSATGKDAIDDFEDVSDNAREMMDQYYVGEIDASTIPKKVAYTPPKQPHYNQDKTYEFIIKLLQFLVPLAILALAVAIRFYTKQA
ncbi:cytochrome b5-like [Benincasa hispida]|uniref:cytochrome b5-like n=1 Tax=Benincasa hispida TaxID=102211 RepID=UPI0018FF92A6|nr:cytochrome b5-like [Benincasa hispida]